MTITVRYTRRPTAADKRTTVAQLPFLNANARALRLAATKLGMQAQGNDEFVAADGSWARLAGGRIERGMGASQFRGIPTPPPPGAPPLAPQKPRAPRDPNAVPRSPPRTPAFMKTTALGQLPMLQGNLEDNASTLEKHGFVRSGTVFTHQDGSRVSFGRGYATLSHNGTPLGRLPRWW